VIEQHLGVAEDHVERGSQLVRDARHELGLEPARFERGVVEHPKLVRALGNLELERSRPGEAAVGALSLVLDLSEDVSVEESDRVEEDDPQEVARVPHGGVRREVQIG
jgi:hypothetical protein